jgi:hypothetical protein
MFSSTNIIQDLNKSLNLDNEEMIYSMKSIFDCTLRNTYAVISGNMGGGFGGGFGNMGGGDGFSNMGSNMRSRMNNNPNYTAF